jgi:hypothetical protein
MSEKDFIFSKSKDYSLSGIKNFPVDFADLNKAKVLDVPDKQLIPGTEFFGSYEVTTASGDFIFTCNDESEAKYISYASLNRKNKIKIPKQLAEIKNAVDSYEKYLDTLLNEIKKDYEYRFRTGKNFNPVSNEIFKRLNLIRL